MKVMNLTGIRHMEMEDIPEPTIQKASDVKVKLGVVAVCGSDVHYYTTGRIGSQIVHYPFPVGHECAGIVTETGSAVTRVKPGDRIAIEPAMPCGKCDQCLAGRPHTCRKLKFLGCPGQADGSLSEYIMMPEGSCFPIPDHMTLDQAAISEPLAIGLYAVRQSIPMQGSKVGILGYGPIGMSVMLTAKAKGGTDFFITDKVHERLNIAHKEGAIITANPDEENVVNKILEKEPKGLDVVFECCGQQEAVEHAIDLLKPGGKIMIIGIPEFDKWSFPVDKCRHKEITITNVRRQNHCLDETLELLSTGKINIQNMPTHRFSFPDTKKAFDLVDRYDDGVMKAMIDF